MNRKYVAVAVQLIINDLIYSLLRLYIAGKGQDGHWTPAADTCNLCVEEYDVIERFETLERDHHYLFHKMGER